MNLISPTKLSKNPWNLYSNPGIKTSVTFSRDDKTIIDKLKFNLKSVHGLLCYLLEITSSEVLQV